MRWHPKASRPPTDLVNGPRADFKAGKLESREATPPPSTHQAARDRAAVVTVGIIQILAAALRRWNAGDLAALASVRAEIAAMLRDEFSDVARQTMTDTWIDD